jgi:hypothetical protein
MRKEVICAILLYQPTRWPNLTATGGLSVVATHRLDHLSGIRAIKTGPGEHPFLPGFFDARQPGGMIRHRANQGLPLTSRSELAERLGVAPAAGVPCPDAAGDSPDFQANLPKFPGQICISPLSFGSRFDTLTAGSSRSVPWEQAYREDFFVSEDTVTMPGGHVGRRKVQPTLAAVANRLSFSTPW